MTDRKKQFRQKKTLSPNIFLKKQSVKKLKKLNVKKSSKNLDLEQITIEYAIRLL